MKLTNSSAPRLQLQLLSGLLVPLCSAFSFLLDSRGKTVGCRSLGGPGTAPRAAGQTAGRGIIDGTTTDIQGANLRCLISSMLIKRRIMMPLSSTLALAEVTPVYFIIYLLISSAFPPLKGWDWARMVDLNHFTAFASQLAPNAQFKMSEPKRLLASLRQLKLCSAARQHVKM